MLAQYVRVFENKCFEFFQLTTSPAYAEPSKIIRETCTISYINNTFSQSNSSKLSVAPFLNVQKTPRRHKSKSHCWGQREVNVKEVLI